MLISSFFGKNNNIINRTIDDLYNRIKEVAPSPWHVNGIIVQHLHLLS